MVRTCIVLIASLLMCGCSTDRGSAARPGAGVVEAVVEVPEPLKPQVLDAAALEYTSSAFQFGAITVAGQPTQARLEKFLADGGTLVVNIRTPAEMADRNRIPFDEAELVRSKGAEYVFIPLGGPKAEFPYDVAATDAFLAALDKHKGKPVLMHCQVGYRASHLWAASLVRSGQASPDQARALLNSMGFGLYPFEGLSGVHAVYVSGKSS